VATDWLVQCQLKEPEQVLEEVILDFFNHRHQRPGRLIWVPRPDQPHVRNVLDVPVPTRDTMLELPQANSASEAEKRVLGHTVQFLSASRETDAPSFLDIDIDSLGLFERNKALCLPTDNDQPTYRIRAKDLQINIFENDQTKTQGYQLDGDDYDAQENHCGFFLGDPLREIFENVEIMLMRMSEDQKKALFVKMDRYKVRGVGARVPSTFFLCRSNVRARTCCIRGCRIVRVRVRADASTRSASTSTRRT